MSLQLVDMPTFSPSLITLHLPLWIPPSFLPFSHHFCIFYPLMESEGLSPAESCGSLERTMGIGTISAVHNSSWPGSCSCKTPPLHPPTLGFSCPTCHFTASLLSVTVYIWIQNSAHGHIFMCRVLWINEQKNSQSHWSTATQAQLCVFSL